MRAGNRVRLGIRRGLGIGCGWESGAAGKQEIVGDHPSIPIWLPRIEKEALNSILGKLHW